MPEIGDLIATYRLTGIVGSGGMGTVYRAHDERLDRDVALKLLSPQLSDDPSFRARFEREARIAGAMRHPNIVPVFDAGEWQGQLYLTMLLVEGPNLATVIKRDAPMAPDRTADIISQVAGALDAANLQGIVHRDVKPANILLVERAAGDGDDHAYLVDFGLTRSSAAMTQMTRTGTFLGTLDYIAPEQLQGEHVDGRADEYALACTAFEMLTAGPPFKRDTEVALISAHLYSPPPVLTDVRPDLPTALSTVLAQAMAKDPQARYPTAGAFAQALSQGTTAREAEATTVYRPVPPPPPVQGVVPGTANVPERRRGNGRGVAIGIGAVFLALLVGLGASLALNNGGPGATILPSSGRIGAAGSDSLPTSANGPPSVGPATDHLSTTSPAQGSVPPATPVFSSAPQVPAGTWQVVFTQTGVEGNPVYRPETDSRTYVNPSPGCGSPFACRVTFHQRESDGTDLGWLDYVWDGEAFVADEPTQNKGHRCQTGTGYVDDAYDAHQTISLTPQIEGQTATAFTGEKTLSGTPNVLGASSGCAPYAVHFAASMTYDANVPIPSAFATEPPVASTGDNPLLNFEYLPTELPADEPFRIGAEWCAYRSGFVDDALASTLTMYVDGAAVATEPQVVYGSDPLGGPACQVANVFVASFPSGLAPGVHTIRVVWQPTWTDASSEDHTMTIT